MAKKLTIITNNQERDFKYGDEVPKETLDWYDWLDEDAKFDGWIQYKNHWYHTSDFMRVPPGMTGFEGWDGYKGDSYFSGTLVKFADDGETYKIGTYIQTG